MTSTLPPRIAEQVRAMPESSMGANRVRVRLRDGTEFSNVYVAWGGEVVRVGSSVDLPFDADDVIQVENQP